MKAIGTRHRSCRCKHGQISLSALLLWREPTSLRSIGLLGDFRNNRPHAGESDNFTQGPNFADPATCILTAKHYKLRDLIEARNNIKSPSRISKARPKSSDISSMSHPGLAKSTNFPLVMYDGLNNLVLFSNSCAEYY